MNTVRKVYVHTMGCQMNEYDSAKMADVLADSEGAVRVDDPEQADILLMNTCSVREKAQEKVFSLLGRWRMLKERRAMAQVVSLLAGHATAHADDHLRAPLLQHPPATQ